VEATGDPHALEGLITLKALTDAPEYWHLALSPLGAEFALSSEFDI
jgi:hypothetical protein